MDVEIRDSPTEVRTAGAGQADLRRRALRKRHVCRRIDGASQDRLTEPSAEVVLERVSRHAQHTLVPPDGARQVVAGKTDVVDREDANWQERLRRMGRTVPGSRDAEGSRESRGGERDEDITAR
jgi:hypothetical protein